MDAPPYYSAPKKSNVGLIIGIILGVVCLCCVLPIIGLGAAGLWGFNKMKGFMGCSISFARLQTAVKGYSDAHGGKLPNAETWQSDVRPYFSKPQSQDTEKAEKILTNGPIDPMGGCKNEDFPTGIAFNSDLSGKKISSIKDPTETVMLFEVPQTGSNLHQVYKAQPYDTSPNVFGNKRGWYVCSIEGRVELIGKGGIRSNGDIAPRGGND